MKIVITVAMLLATLSVSSQIIKFRAYQRTIYNPDGTKEESQVNTLIVFNSDQSQITLYLDRTIHLDIVKYLQHTSSTDGSINYTENLMEGVDDSNVKVKIKLMLITGSSEAAITLDYRDIGGGMIGYQMRDTQ